jgi:hypothetical protein
MKEHCHHQWEAKKVECANKSFFGFRRYFMTQCGACRIGLERLVEYTASQCKLCGAWSKPLPWTVSFHGKCDCCGKKFYIGNLMHPDTPDVFFFKVFATIIILGGSVMIITIYLSYYVLR